LNGIDQRQAGSPGLMGRVIPREFSRRGKNRKTLTGKKLGWTVLQDYRWLSAILEIPLL